MAYHYKRQTQKRPWDQQLAWRDECRVIQRVQKPTKITWIHTSERHLHPTSVDVISWNAFLLFKELPILEHLMYKYIGRLKKWNMLPIIVVYWPLIFLLFAVYIIFCVWEICSSTVKAQFFLLQLLKYFHSKKYWLNYNCYLYPH